MGMPWSRWPVRACTGCTSSCASAPWTQRLHITTCTGVPYPARLGACTCAASCVHVSHVYDCVPIQMWACLTQNDAPVRMETRAPACHNISELPRVCVCVRRTAELVGNAAANVQTYDTEAQGIESASTA